jgi:ribonucleoside-diphosphate reductase subunit M1
MKVLKRNNTLEDISFDKILNRLKLLCFDDEFDKKLDIDYSIIAQKVCSEIYDGIDTYKLDELSAQITISLYSKNQLYSILASRIIISNHHKKTNNTFSEKIKQLFHKDIIHEYLFNVVEENKDIINKYINYNRDYSIDFFGFKTLEKSYLLKIDGNIIESPQDLFMRVSLCIHRDDIQKAFETYDHLSNKNFIHATPTLFNAGTKREQLASCFLLSMNDDSISGIYKTLNDCALISKYAGGIGLHVHNVRANGSYIAGTNGTSNGLVPMLRVYNDTARYVDQGGGKRNGSFAIYLEPWHSDIFEFLELKKNHGNELERARDLFYGLWIPNLFMERVKNDGEWSLFCPNKCPGLSDCYDDDFNKLYNKYESEGKYNKKVRAHDLWFAILSSQIETGTPYLLYKDECNRKSNQKNVGIIKSSNLCTEIIEYSDKNETAVCNLASISLPSCVEKHEFDSFTIYSKDNCKYCNWFKNICKNKNIDYNEVLLHKQKDRINLYERIEENHNKLVDSMPQIFLNETYVGGFNEFIQFIKPKFNYEKLQNLTETLTLNLNKIIDYNFYPTPETKRSNMRHRPIGIGVQGLVNTFYEMDLPFDCDEARELNKNIFETIYYASINKSMQIAKSRQEIISKLKILSEKTDLLLLPEEFNILKKEINVNSDELNKEFKRNKYFGSYETFEGSPTSQGLLQFDLWNGDINHNLKYDWDELKENIQKYGLRNSLCVAPMPTASTSQILGNFECFEPIISNIFTRRVLAGEFLVLNNYLVKDLINVDMWSEDMKNNIIVNDGSIQNIEKIPEFIRNKYKTAWEISQKKIIDMAADRGKYICQSQSMNLFISSPNNKILSSMHFYAWNKGLKTGMYYLRTRPSSKAIQFTIKPDECENCSG